MGSEKCCFCFKLKTGLKILFVIDIIALVMYIINAAVVSQMKDDLDELNRFV